MCGDIALEGLHLHVMVVGGPGIATASVSESPRRLFGVEIRPHVGTQL
jgi:hypothetical protein